MDIDFAVELAQINRHFIGESVDFRTVQDFELFLLFFYLEVHNSLELLIDELFALIPSVKVGFIFARNNEGVLSKQQVTSIHVG